MAELSKLKNPKGEEDLEMEKGGEMQVQKRKVAASTPYIYSLSKVPPHWVETALLGSWLLVRFVI